MILSTMIEYIDTIEKYKMTTFNPHKGFVFRSQD